MAARAVAGMHGFISELFSWLACRFRGRADLELEIHCASPPNLPVLHRQRLGRPRLYSIDRLLWGWLYRAWRRCLDVVVLVKPATVIQRHRRGFSSTGAGSKSGRGHQQVVSFASLSGR